MDHHGQQSAQQKLRVVSLRVDQRNGLGDERSNVGRFWCCWRGGALDGGGEAVAQA